MPVTQRHPDEEPHPTGVAEGYFRTDHLMGDLEGRSVRGGAITLTTQAIKFALHIASTVILARLLTPADFGLVAMVTAVTGFVVMFKDAGLSMATVQRERINHAQVSTLFWINVVLSAGIMAAIAALAPAIAWFYSEPRLSAITFALAGTLIFSGLTVQHQALLRRQMRFASLAAIEISAITTGMATAIVLAWLGFGYWALVGAAAGSTLANCVLVWTLSTWRPGWPRRNSGVIPMLKFGGNLTASNLLAYSRRNLDNVLIGAVWGADSLGIYAKAYGLLLLPIQQINRPVAAVAIPALSRLQTDPAGYKRYYRRLIEVIAAAGIPIATFAALKASIIIEVFLGEQWSEAVPVFLALCPAGLVGVMNIAGGVVFVSLGRTDRQLKITLLTTPIVIAGFLAGLPYGPFGVAVGFSVTFTAVFPAIIWYAFRDSPLRPWDLLSGLVRPACAAFGSTTVVLIFSAIAVDTTTVVDLVTSFVVFSISYTLLLFLLSGGKQSVANALLLLRGRSTAC